MLTKGGAPPGGLPMPMNPNGLVNGFPGGQFGMPGMMPGMPMGGAPGAPGGMQQMANPMLTNPQMYPGMSPSNGTLGMNNNSTQGSFGGMGAGGFPGDFSNNR